MNEAHVSDPSHHAIFGSDLEQWARAHVTVAEKWDGRMPGVGDAPGDWKERARRAEARASVLRAEAIGWRLRTAAHTVRYQDDLAVIKGSVGWKLTAPLRGIGKLRRRDRS